MANIVNLGSIIESNTEKVKILVKSREELQKLLDEYCLANKDKFSEKGICSENYIRKAESHRYDLFAGKEIEAEKVYYEENYTSDFAFDYRVKYIESDGSHSIFPIFPNEIVKEIKENTVQEIGIFYKGSNFYVMEDGTIVGEPNLRSAIWEMALALKGQEDIKEFLEEWSSCSNRCTAFPYYWTIADERPTYSLDKRGEYVYDYNNAEMRKITEVLQEMQDNRDIDIPGDTNFAEIIDSVGDIFESEVVEESLKKYINSEHLDRYEMQYETYYEGVFFTEQDAKEYLESCKNHHFGPNPRVYLESFNKWGRHSRTEDFLQKLFNFFNVPVPPELYYEKGKEEV